MKLRKNLFNYRAWIQGMSTFFTNPHLSNFFSGKLYTGPLKRVCVPGLNCYSCPAAGGACPIGAFQAVVGSSSFRFSYYITGILILIGVALGRVVCGFLCPFGWFQDLLHRVPVPKRSTEKLKALSYLKYPVLVVAVWLLGVCIVDDVGMSEPYFCKYICPQGILEGAIPLSITNSGIRDALGPLFMGKSAILVSVVVLSMVFYRPFCKWICPLGAFYSLFNGVSFFQYHVDDHCIQCGKCKQVCRMDVDMSKTQNHRECIRCGDCLKACPTGSISATFGSGVTPSKREGARLEKTKEIKEIL
ncbi:MAG: 4Fe-4S binding protein [Peptoniphilus sp.]|nr:4Fe-4S binding protein [Peptoniphilus sp.]MDD7362635.1 4Fe-4S binding protein [Bacillota bacterium]MDY6044966.1 4Fe-4S binding protein [Peptoniphilus sp.]